MSGDLTGQDAQAARADLGEVVGGLRRTKVALALLMGLATGIPFVLVGVTLGFWLREAGTALAAIGFLSWLGLTFSLKFVWAPAIDRLDPPLFARLGRTRGWMVLGQAVCAVGLIGMAIVGPTGGLAAFVAFALVAGFASATQDIAVDSWRIRIAEDKEQDLVASAYTFGLRGGYFLGDVGVLLGAALAGWSGAYAGAAIVVGAIGLLAALRATEPPPAPKPPAAKSLVARFAEAFASPVARFFTDHGPGFWPMAVLVGVYFIPDLLMGPMVAPLYVDLGFCREQIAATRAVFGMTGVLLGVAAAGAAGTRFGSLAAVAIGAALAAASNLGFAALALTGSEAVWRGAALVDGFSQGFATAAMIAWAGRLTAPGHTAMQFALLSSLMTFAGQALRGFSGAAVESLQAAVGAPMPGYAWFFAATALTGLPVLALIAFVARLPRQAPA